MKKIIAVTISLIILFYFQQINAQTFSLGARAGLSLANLSFDPDLPSYVEKSGRTTVKLGVLAEVGFASMFALQVEPMYGQGGAKLSAGGQEETDKVSYFEIPILFKVKIPVSGPVTPYAFAGPNLAFVMSAKSETRNTILKIELPLLTSDSISVLERALKLHRLSVSYWMFVTR